MHAAAKFARLRTTRLGMTHQEQKPMRFERELKPYAEPVSERELKEGEIYFFVNFVDDEMLIPTMETVVFVGKNLDRGDTDRVYFQDIDSFRRGIRFSTAQDEDFAMFQSGSQSELGHVFEYEGALDVLMACSVRRRS
jgi:hypothetical protein